MRFSEIIGNKDSVRRLRESVVYDRVFHSYIIDGADGIGKKRLAYTFAQALLCQNPEASGEPCQECPACRKTAERVHGDIHFITWDGKSIKDEQIEAIQEILFSKPFDGNKSIIIIEKADTMTDRAQNRLLKTLEEPGESLLIILLTEKISDILPTIVSRSVVVRMKPVPGEEILKYLINNEKTEINKAEVASAYANGSPGRALCLINDESFAVKRSRGIELAKGLVDKRSIAEFMNLLKNDIEYKDRILELLEIISFWYRDVLLIKQGMDSGLLLNRDEADEIRLYSKRLSLHKTVRIIAGIEDAKHRISANISIKFILENLYLDVK